MATGISIDQISSGRMEYPWSSIIWLEVKHACRYVVSAVIIAVVIYLCVAATTARYIAVPGSGGSVYTANPDYDSLKNGTPIVFDKDKRADDSKDADSFIGRLSLTFLPPSGISTGKVIAGPDGQFLKDKHGRIRVKGVDTGLKEAKGYLADQYVVECTGGACAADGMKGKSIIIPIPAVDGTIVKGGQES